MATTFATTLTAPYDTLTFVAWQGPRPKQVTREVQLFRRFGATNPGAVVLPYQGAPFSATAIQIYSSAAYAEAAINNLRALIGTTVQIVWETVNMATTYDTEYLVLGFETDGWQEIHSYQDYAGTYQAPAWEVDWLVTLHPILIPEA